MSTFDTFLFLGIAITSIAGIYLLDKYEQRKAGRTIHKRFNTNYARHQAKLAASSKSIRKGHRR